MAHRRGRGNRPHLYILRGLPGSGKTYLASEIMEQYDNKGEILSTDDYFIHNGAYEFKYHQLNRAHDWNQERAQECMQEGVHPIIIDNTNMRLCEMKPYVEMGLDNRYYIQMKTTPRTWSSSIEELYVRCNCVVPMWVIRRMKRNYEPARTIYDVLNDSRYY